MPLLAVIYDLYCCPYFRTANEMNNSVGTMPGSLMWQILTQSPLEPGRVSETAERTLAHDA